MRQPSCYISQGEIFNQTGATRADDGTLQYGDAPNELTSDFANHPHIDVRFFPAAGTELDPAAIAGAGAALVLARRSDNQLEQALSDPAPSRTVRGLLAWTRAHATRFYNC